MKRLLSATAVLTLLLGVSAQAQQEAQSARPQQERRVIKPIADKPATTSTTTLPQTQPISPGSIGQPATGLPAGAKPFGNWIYSCAPQVLPDGKPGKVCNLRTGLVVEDPETKQQSVAASVILARTVGEKQAQIIVQLPLSSLLLMRPRILGSDSRPITELAWVACNQQLCLSSMALNDTQMALLQKLGDTLSVVYRTQNGQDIKIDGSSKGIAEGLNALVQEK